MLLREGHKRDASFTRRVLHGSSQRDRAWQVLARLQTVSRETVMQSPLFMFLSIHGAIATDSDTCATGIEAMHSDSGAAFVSLNYLNDSIRIVIALHLL